MTRARWPFGRWQQLVFYKDKVTIFDFIRGVDPLGAVLILL